LILIIKNEDLATFDNCRVGDTVVKQGPLKPHCTKWRYEMALPGDVTKWRYKMTLQQRYKVALQNDVTTTLQSDVTKWRY